MSVLLETGDSKHTFTIVVGSTDGADKENG